VTFNEQQQAVFTVNV